MASTVPSPNDLTRQQLDELDALLQRMLSLPISPPSPQTTPAPAPDIAKPAAPPFPLPRGWDEPAVTQPLPVPPTGWRTDIPAPQPKPPHLVTPTVEPEPVLAELPVVAPMPLDPPVPPALDSRPTMRVPNPITRPESFTPPPQVREPELPNPNPFSNLANHPREEPKPTPPPLPMPESEPIVGPGTLRGVDAPLLPPGYPLPGSELPMSEPVDVREPADEPEPITVSTLPTGPVPTVVRRRRSVPIPLLPLFASNAVIEVVFGLLGPIGAAATQPLGKQILGWSGLGMTVAAGVWVAMRTGVIPGM